MITLEKIHVGNGCYQYTPESINYINTMMQARGLSTVTEAIELIERGEDFAAPEELIPVPINDLRMLSKELRELTQKVRATYDEAGGLAIALGNPGAVSALLIEKFPEERLEDLGAAAIFAGLESELTTRDLEALSTPGALMSFS